MMNGIKRERKEKDKKNQADERTSALFGY